MEDAPLLNHMYHGDHTPWEMVCLNEPFIASENTLPMVMEDFSPQPQSVTLLTSRSRATFRALPGGRLKMVRNHRGRDRRRSGLGAGVNVAQALPVDYSVIDLAPMTEAEQQPPHEGAKGRNKKVVRTVQVQVQVFTLNQGGRLY